MNRTPGTQHTEPKPPSVSHSFLEISRDQAVAHPYTDSWLDPSIPPQQLALVRHELSQWFAGLPFPLFDTLVNALKHIPTPAPFPDYTPSILDVGCGVGHYAPVVHRAGVYRYVGVDYNGVAIGLAQKQWHDLALNTLFAIMPADQLLYDDGQFDIVLSGAVLLHMIDWQAALAEAARVAKSHLILHRTPIARHRTRYFVKHAYSVPCLELHFSEHDLFEQIYRCGFELKHSWKTSEDLNVTYKTYLLERSKR